MSTEFKTNLLDDSVESNSITHYYRAMVTRSNAWRRIVDATTNWAVAATAAMFSVGFSGTGVGHAVLFLAHFLILMFLLIEARRYAFYTTIDWRVRLMETEFLAAILAGDREKAGRGEWRQILTDSTLRPHQPITIWEAMSLRLSRTYIWIFLLLTAAWFIRIASFPEPVSSLAGLWRRGGFDYLPGWATWLAIFALYAVLGRAIFSLRRTRRRLDRQGFCLGHVGQDR